MEYAKCENAGGLMAMAMHADSIRETSTVGLDASAFNEVGPERDFGAGAVVPEGTHQRKHLKLTDPSGNDDPKTKIRTTDSPISLYVLWGSIGTMTTIWYLSRNMSQLEYPIYMNLVFVWIPIVLMLFAIKVGLDIGGSADDEKSNRALLETEERRRLVSGAYQNNKWCQRYGVSYPDGDTPESWPQEIGQCDE